uniref:Toxoplasma gondii family A protein n=1 Tax=Neospora caninum (strain Liverpool) TaxID=572307 RepID=A0A0F7UAF1_NEOCL|nr:TPA: hypothetical protein BN1204_017911 [Neospora caninum Liverpool]
MCFRRTTKRHALQIVLLAFLLAAAVPCAASEASGSEPEPDFTVTISKEGIAENSQREFSLGPSATLRVVDETGKATLLPAPGAAGDSEAGQYSVAYVFENGQCNFEKTVAYKDAFPGYSEELWVRTGTEAGTGEEGTGEVGNYTFTNPPDEYLSGGFSFCVRFTTNPAATSTTTPSPITTSLATTVRPSASSDGSSSDPTLGGASGNAAGPGNQDGHGSDGEAQTEDKRPVEEEVERPGVPAGPSHVQEESGLRGSVPDHTVAGSSENQVASEHTSSPIATTPSRSSSDLTNEEQTTPNMVITTSPTLADSSLPSGTKGSSTAPAPLSTLEISASLGSSDNKGADGDGHARLRRLSDSEASEAKYLTIVVHSAAYGSTAGTSLVAASVLAMTASVLSSF